MISQFQFYFQIYNYFVEDAILLFLSNWSYKSRKDDMRWHFLEAILQKFPFFDWLRVFQLQLLNIMFQNLISMKINKGNTSRDFRVWKYRFLSRKAKYFEIAFASLWQMMKRYQMISNRNPCNMSVFRSRTLLLWRRLNAVGCTSRKLCSCEVVIISIARLC